MCAARGLRKADDMPTYVLSHRHDPQECAVAIAAWLSVMGGAAAASLELWLSGRSPLHVVLPAMLGVHALIGIGEALITVSALAMLQRARPALLKAVSG